MCTLGSVRPLRLWRRIASTGIKLAALGMGGRLPATNEAMDMLPNQTYHPAYQSVTLVVLENPVAQPGTQSAWITVPDTDLAQLPGLLQAADAQLKAASELLKQPPPRREHPRNKDLPGW